MVRLRSLRDSLPLFWLLLAVPAVLQLSGWWSGRIDTMDMLHPTGETSARLMIAAMLIGPMMGLIGPRPWLRWLLARRRALGVAAFCYAVLHTIFYVVDMGNVADMLAEALAPGIWTGWAALLLFVPMALTSNNAAMRKLRRAWKQVQRLAYPAALLTLLHWAWVHGSYTAALAHLAPLALVWLMLAARRFSTNLPSPQIHSGV
jgi:methionine sulfoxide reductase heme-binding subunit